MTDLWDKFTIRAKELAAAHAEASELLLFYARLLEAQGRIYEELANAQGWLPSGVLSQDIETVRSQLPILLTTVKEVGPPKLAVEADHLMSAPQSVLDEVLVNYWFTPSDVQFFGKAVFQPYLRRLFEIGTKPIDRGIESSGNRCPFCGGRPQLAYMTAQDPASDGGSKQLLCSACLTSWPFRRVVCAQCNEERPARLCYFHNAEWDYIRADACDTCHSYLKSIDLSRLGIAIPLIDEVAAPALDVWAVQHGYKKIELNLIGL